MKKIIGGALAIILGLPGFSLFFSYFTTILTGIIPVLLILGGGLAFYLGYEDRKAQQAEDFTDDAVSDEIPSSMDAETAEIEEKSADNPEDTAPNFLGNTDTFVFHSVECNFSEGKKCTQGFITREQAVEQGYKPCKICNP